MSDDPSLHQVCEPIGALTSLAAASVLLVLLHRVIATDVAQTDFLLIGIASELGLLERTYLVGFGVICLWAIANNRRSALAGIQLCALGCGLFLTQYILGHAEDSFGEKVEPSFALTLITNAIAMAGVVSLYSCYLCLIAHVAIGIRLWKLRR